jgi:hypothetical protein
MERMVLKRKTAPDGLAPNCSSWGVLSGGPGPGPIRWWEKSWETAFRQVGGGFRATTHLSKAVWPEFCGVGFWGSGRPLGALKPSKNVGGEAPYIFGWF